MPGHIRYSTPYETSTALPIPFSGQPKVISNYDMVRTFWQKNQFRNKTGCYIFAASHGHILRPWYVGKTDLSFARECFTDHKLDHYNAVMKAWPNYQPRMLFVCRADSRGRPESIPHTWAETELIKMLVQVNPQLRNDKNAETSVLLIKGVTDLRRGRKPDATRDFRALLGAGV